MAMLLNPHRGSQWLYKADFKKVFHSWAPVAHTCNLSYSGGKEQEDRGSKPAQENSSQDPVLKKPFRKKGWRSNLRYKP
jgi:hypothetical protein